MKVCIAEKPSAAREIAAILGATSKKDGYMEGNGYAVTWAFGHLVELAMPEQYGITGFHAEDLPILPQEFKLVPRQVKQGMEYKPDPGVMKQLKVIRELFSRADEIICCMDAGREGELIHRYIYSYLECTKPCERLWISSLTDRAIREGFRSLRPGSEYDNLYLAAFARAKADYLVGLNASRALSIAAGNGVWSLGRVQTPTLAIVCSRYLENRDFKPQAYFRLRVQTAGGDTPFAALSEQKYDTAAAATEALQRVKAAGTLRVTGVEKKEVKQEPPLPYNLTCLQKEANGRHGFSADKTLNIAQGLYEKSKVLSYPRTGSRYISADVLDEIPRLIATLKGHPRFGAYAAGVGNTVLNTRCVDKKKVADHHALIITGETSGSLSPEEQAIYDMVAGRMLEAFSYPCTKENTAVSLDAGGVHFSCKGSVTLVPGWRAVCNDRDEPNESEDEPDSLPVLAEGDVLPIRDAEALEKQTKARPLHTEGSLLGAMESCGRECLNEDEREAMKQAGIGTPATRAAIIETLFSREYIRREKKSLVPTNKGLVVYFAVKDKKIADVSMTGGWEHALDKIASGGMDAADFHKGIEVYTAQITAELLEGKIEGANRREEYPCPKCKSGRVTVYRKVAKCNNGQCGLTVFRSKAGKDLAEGQLKDLLTKGKTGIIKGFKSKEGKPFDAAVAFDAEYKTVFRFDGFKDRKKK